MAQSTIFSPSRRVGKWEVRKWEVRKWKSGKVEEWESVELFGRNHLPTFSPSHSTATAQSPQTSRQNSLVKFRRIDDGAGLRTTQVDEKFSVHVFGQHPCTTIRKGRNNDSRMHGRRTGITG